MKPNFVPGIFIDASPFFNLAIFLCFRGPFRGPQNVKTLMPFLDTRVSVFTISFF